MFISLKAPTVVTSPMYLISNHIKFFLCDVDQNYNANSIFFLSKYHKNQFLHHNNTMAIRCIRYIFGELSTLRFSEYLYHFWNYFSCQWDIQRNFASCFFGKSSIWGGGRWWKKVSGARFDVIVLLHNWPIHRAIIEYFEISEAFTLAK